MSTDEKFTNLVQTILDKGEVVETRNSRCVRLTNQMLTFSSFPLVTSRKTAWKSAIREMEWFLSGSSNIKDLHPSVRPWWQPWVDSYGAVYNNYSKQFRHFAGQYGEMDQIEYLIDGIKNHPFSRRNVITTWNTFDMSSKLTRITNCHGTVIQAFVRHGKGKADRLDLTMYQRSADVMLGLPHNLVQYWAFLKWLCMQTGLKMGELTWIGGDCHIYEDHVELARKLKYIGKYPASPYLGYLQDSPVDFKADDFILAGGKYEYIFSDKLEMIV